MYTSVVMETKKPSIQLYSPYFTARDHDAMFITFTLDHDPPML